MNAAAVILLFGMVGCTVIGAGVGAVGGAVLTGGNPIGVVGGAVVGGVIGTVSVNNIVVVMLIQRLLG